MDRLQAVLATKFADRLTFRLQQSHLAGTCDRFSAPLNLEFAKDFLDVPFHRVPGEEEALANLMIRESLGNELQYFQLAFTQWLGKGRMRFICALVLLGLED